MTTFSVWAPLPEQVDVEVDGVRHSMHPATRAGWWQADVADAGHGSDYAFVLDGTDPLPDPRSAWQPHGVHGPSCVVDHSTYDWKDAGWRGAALAGSVVYELHVGTFTPDGTLDAATRQLDHLVELGVDLVELMPVAAFEGGHGWGYDGVDLYAVHEPYGGPHGLKRFVDACHAKGLGVVLDVVYNHLGPSGNYLPRFGPYFTERHHTPWGAAVNLDDAGSDEVRRWLVDNALMWLRDYHVDGLRLDAVHALIDDRATHLLEELAAEVDAFAASTGRPLSLVAESDLNDPRVVTPRVAGGYGVSAQWNDDFHHALHCLLTGERQGYYADFGSLGGLAKTLTQVFLHDGSWSSFRGRRHGRPVDTGRTPGWRFLGYLQTHDQVGNRAVGDRISATLSHRLVKVGATLALTAPFTPLLFMGEEWAAGTPWQYFTDFAEPDLADGVRRGRRHEFAAHGWAEDDIPDPQDPATFARSKLDWSEPIREPHAGILECYRALIRLRRSRPELADPRLDRVEVAVDEDQRCLAVHRGPLRVVANLSTRRCTIPLDGSPRGLLHATEPGFAFGDGFVQLDGESAAVVELVD